MTAHIPTEHAGVYRCPACAFHAVATCEGLHVIDSGAGRQLHMEAIAQQQIEQAARAEELRQMVERQIRRLIWLYQESMPLPGPDPDAWRPTPPLSMRQVRKYGQYIKKEHGL